jgi:hypothetical protein
MTTLASFLSAPATLSADRPTVEAPIVQAPAMFTLRLDRVQTPAGAIVPNARAVVRNDTGEALAAVGSRYTICQPAEALAIAQALAPAGAEPKVAILGNGADVVIDWRGPEFQVGGDTLREQVTMRANNTGRAPLVVTAGLWRKWCSNGAFAAVKGKSCAVRIRHTASGPARMRALMHLSAELSTARASLTDTFRALMARTVNPRGDEVRAYFERLAPLPELPAQATTAQRQAHADESADVRARRANWFRTFEAELSVRGVGADNGPNAYLALNAVTRWAQHGQEIRGARQHPERRIYANLPGGRGAELTVEAQRAAVEMFLN